MAVVAGLLPWVAEIQEDLFNFGGTEPLSQVLNKGWNENYIFQIPVPDLLHGPEQNASVSLYSNEETILVFLSHGGDKRPFAAANLHLGSSLYCESSFFQNTDPSSFISLRMIFQNILVHSVFFRQVLNFSLSQIFLLLMGICSISIIYYIRLYSTLMAIIAPMKTTIRTAQTISLPENLLSFILVLPFPP